MLELIQRRCGKRSRRPAKYCTSVCNARGFMCRRGGRFPVNRELETLDPRQQVPGPLGPLSWSTIAETFSSNNVTIHGPIVYRPAVYTHCDTHVHEETWLGNVGNVRNVSDTDELREEKRKPRGTVSGIPFSSGS